MFKKKKPKPGAEDAPADGEAPAAAVDGADGAEGEGAPKKKKLPMLVIAIAAGVLVLGGGGTGAFFMLQPKAPADAAKEKKDKKKKDDKSAEGAKKDDKNAPVIRDGPDGVVFYTLPDQRGEHPVRRRQADLPEAEAHLRAARRTTRPTRSTDDMPRLQDMFRPSCASCGPRISPAARAAIS